MVGPAGADRHAESHHLLLIHPFPGLHVDDDAALAIGELLGVRPLVEFQTAHALGACAGTGNNPEKSVLTGPNKGGLLGRVPYLRVLRGLFNTLCWLGPLHSRSCSH